MRKSSSSREEETLMLFLTQTVGGISIDWTINVGHIGTAAVAVLICSRVFYKMQNKIEKIEEDMEEFKLGLRDFQKDFRQLGAQVVHALVAIARLEGKSFNGEVPPSAGTVTRAPDDYRG